SGGPITAPSHFMIRMLIHHCSLLQYNTQKDAQVKASIFDEGHNLPDPSRVPPREMKAVFPFFFSFETLTAAPSASKSAKSPHNHQNLPTSLPNPDPNALLSVEMIVSYRLSFCRSCLDKRITIQVSWGNPWSWPMPRKQGSERRVPPARLGVLYCCYSCR